MTKQTLERLEAEASTMADHHRPPSDNERREVDASRGGERRVPERRWSAEYEMMPPPPSPALRPKSATPRRDFSQPRSKKRACLVDSSVSQVPLSPISEFPLLGTRRLPRPRRTRGRPRTSLLPHQAGALWSSRLAKVSSPSPAGAL